MQDGDIHDLSDVSRAAEDLLQHIRRNQIQAPVNAIASVCKEVHRAWSGSSIGYHASVYYRNLEPKPAGVEFSSEWGLMDRWPTHQPDAGWTPMDDAIVESEILGRAGNPDLQALEKMLIPIRENFEYLKSTAASILSATLAKGADPYLQTRLDQVETLDAPNASIIARKLLPERVTSRDSRAMSQGLRIAPHQVVAAHSMAAEVLEIGISDLRKLAQESASHIRRVSPRGNKMTLSAAPNSRKVFCGHGRSPLWREVKDFIKDRLGLPVEEFNNVPTAGIPTAVRLSEMLESAAFAFLVMTGEDEQPDGKLRARENVIHEVGLFQGKLGFGRAIVLLEEGCEEFSNIHGLGQIRFPKGNVSSVFEQIRAVLEREGLL